jgi:hypothetical protein
MVFEEYQGYPSGSALPTFTWVALASKRLLAMSVPSALGQVWSPRHLFEYTRFSVTRAFSVLTM